MTFLRFPATLPLLVLLSLALPQAQPPPAQRLAGTIKEGVTAVLVDVVVRDRRGQPVRDLTQADFELLENGVPQTIGSFTPIVQGSRGTAGAAIAASPAAAPSATPAEPVTAPGAADPAVTALVFHGLSPDGRRRAVRAAQTYLGAKEEMQNYVGIFGIDLSLTPLVPFTRNGVAVRQALARMASATTAGFNTPEQQRQQASAEQQARVSAGTAAAAGAGGRGNATAGAAGGDARLAEMEASILSGFSAMERDQQGYIATDALFAIVSTLGGLPGRKSVILFSEGVAIPNAVARLFSGVIDAANRGNVSIYTIDAAGLRAESEQSRVRDMVNAAGGGVESGYSADTVGAPLTTGLEMNEEALRSDPATGLARLARETGGQSFNNTNNLRPAFERIDNDLRNYYLLGYTPLNSAYDGRFRTIQVRVKRPGVTVAARKGYFAVRNPGASPVNDWEAPALGALEQKPVPNAFPIRAGALLFPEPGRPGLVPVVVNLQTAPITFQPAADGKSYTSDFTVLVRFLDRDNQVARKVSQHYEIRGELAQIERATRGDVVFYRESELTPGVYAMEAIVHDALSGQSSVRFSTVEVPREREGALRMSSLVLVNRSEKLAAEDRRSGSPLLVDNLILYPNLGEPVSKTAKEVGFYFAVYPAPGGAPVSLIQLRQNESLIAQLPMPEAAVDASGRQQQVGRLPVSQLAPGTYELRAVVQQGSAQVFRSTPLRLTE